MSDFNQRLMSTYVLMPERHEDRLGSLSEYMAALPVSPTTHWEFLLMLLWDLGHMRSNMADNSEGNFDA